mmetsp:Transcript_234/g.915  ORF Transcript_234/g.915 Transcript_234/m.915 type:complete len:289 (+) Transcript_234:387-1253(+)
MFCTRTRLRRCWGSGFTKKRRARRSSSSCRRSRWPLGRKRAGAEACRKRPSGRSAQRQRQRSPPRRMVSTTSSACLAARAGTSPSNSNSNSSRPSRTPRAAAGRTGGARGAGRAAPGMARLPWASRSPRPSSGPRCRGWPGGRSSRTCCGRSSPRARRLPEQGRGKKKKDKTKKTQTRWRVVVNTSGMVAFVAQALSSVTETSSSSKLGASHTGLLQEGSLPRSVSLGPEEAAANAGSAGLATASASDSLLPLLLLSRHFGIHSTCPMDQPLSPRPWRTLGKLAFAAA